MTTNADWLFMSWLASLSDWAIAERIARFEAALSDGLIASGAAEIELMVLYGEQARRVALANMFSIVYRPTMPLGFSFAKRPFYRNVDRFVPGVVHK